MKIFVAIKFNLVKNRFDMFIGKYFVMDFPPCKNFELFFDSPSHKKKETYTIDIKRKE